MLSATNEGLRLHGYRKTPGGRFTLDGISAQTLGLPLTQLPVDIHAGGTQNAYGVVLRKAPGIFNLLQNQGYRTAFFSGTSKDFTHKADFLRAHGFSETYFEEPKSRSKRSRYSSENDVLIEKSVKYTDFFLLSIVYV